MITCIIIEKIFYVRKDLKIYGKIYIIISICTRQYYLKDYTSLIFFISLIQNLQIYRYVDIISDKIVNNQFLYFIVFKY
jgi:hypothetical protein